MQEDVLGTLKELTGENKTRYTACSRCARPLLREEARPGAISRFAPTDAVVAEREELCPSCYEDYLKGDLLPAEDEEGR